MAKSAQDYIARCERAGEPPDMHLLESIAAIFQNLQASQETQEQ
jgi:hypothetical protein